MATTTTTTTTLQPQREQRRQLTTATRTTTTTVHIHPRGEAEARHDVLFHVGAEALRDGLADALLERIPVVAGAGLPGNPGDHAHGARG